MIAVNQSIDLSVVLGQLILLVQNVGRLQTENLGRVNLVVDAKSTLIDLVTEIDKKSEAIILAFIRERFPDHGILAEESGQSAGEADYFWTVDPLDGTTNYAQGLPIFSISIALSYRGQTVLGIVYAPVLNELYYAIRGQGAFLNDKPIRVSEKKRLIDCVLATGFPYDVASHPANNIRSFGSLLPKTRAIRRFGSAAYDLAGVACGRFDGYWELNLSPWDAAAGILLVEEAGGIVLPFRTDRKISIIAGNRCLVGQIEHELQQQD